MITAIVLFVVVVVMILSNLVSFLGDFSSQAYAVSGPSLVEVLVEDHESRHKIAVINIDGLIYGGSVGAQAYDLPRMVREQLKRAEKDSRVRAVILRIDSPGGEVMAADSIYDTIEKFQKDTRKPVIASMGGLAASGGYYVAAPCRWIVAHELTITGSIGVIMQTYNYRGLMNKVGLRPQVFKSGKFKDMLSGNRDLEDMSPEEKEIYRQEQAMVQDLINETFDRFKTVIQEGRKNSATLNKASNLKDNWTDLADGRILSGKQAYDSGFVDELGDFEVAVQRAAKIAGIPDANLVTYGIPFDLMNFFRLFGKTDAASVKIDLGVDLPQLRNGCLYYLSPALAY